MLLLSRKKLQNSYIHTRIYIVQVIFKTVTHTHIYIVQVIFITKMSTINVCNSIW